jgi:dihydrofolate reductase
MGKVFFDVGMTLDGFIAGPNGGPKNPLGDGGLRIHDWMFEQKAFRQHLRIGNDGKTGPDNDLIERTFRRIGANIMGRRMFDGGESNWPDDTFQAAPVFVMTHHVRLPGREAGETFSISSINRFRRSSKRPGTRLEEKTSEFPEEQSQFSSS